MRYVILGETELALEKSYTISRADNDSHITQTDYLNAIRHVRVARDVREALNRVDVRDDETKLHTWVVTGKGTYVGSWSKRLSKFVHKTHHIKLDPQTLSIISERIMRTMKGTAEDFIVQFSLINWNAGEFGEKTDSCWFGNHSYAYCQRGLYASGQGGGLKIYTSDGYRRARCWFYNLENNLLLFNAYDREGKLDILSIARMISIRFGMDYYKHPEVVVDKAYVNGRSIYAVGNPPLTRPITLDFALRATSAVPTMEDEPAYYIRSNRSCPNCESDANEFVKTAQGIGCRFCASKCSMCLNFVQNSYVSYEWNGNIICPACREEHFKMCPDCDELVSIDSITCPACESHANKFQCSSCDEWCEGEKFVTTNGSIICEGCYDDRYCTCEDCESIIHIDNSHFLQHYERTVCDDCLDNYTECSICEELYEGSEINSIDDNWVCNDCESESDSIQCCSRCGDAHHVEFLGLVNIDESGEMQDWCSGCRENHSEYCMECAESYDIALHHNHDDDESEEDDDED